MKKINLYLLSASMLILGNSCRETNSQIQEAKGLALEMIATGLNSPIAFAEAPDESNRFFIAEQGGLIKIYSEGVILPTPFLDLKSKMISLNAFYDERGLLGFAFHPDFKTNRKFYVYYSASSSLGGSDHKSILAEYEASSSDPNLSSVQERLILSIEQPEPNHNGGQLAFGADGYLYIALGDGGGAGDEHGSIGNGQDLNTLLGKIIRIDVNSIQPYAIPADNPFAGNINAKAEIWAYGLRNPWRFSFDRSNGQLLCADVGQNEYEEINIIEKGKNYGWRIMEGFHCFNPEQNCNQQGLSLPIHEYSHDVGKSITGGFVYRGKDIPYLQGKYIFGDWTGPLFSLDHQTENAQRSELVFANKPEDLRILSFGEDRSGELYALTSLEVTPRSSTGSVYKITYR